MKQERSEEEGWIPEILLMKYEGMRRLGHVLGVIIPAVILTIMLTTHPEDSVGLTLAVIALYYPIFYGMTWLVLRLGEWVYVGFQHDLD